MALIGRCTNGDTFVQRFDFIPSATIQKLAASGSNLGTHFCHDRGHDSTAPGPGTDVEPLHACSVSTPEHLVNSGPLRHAHRVVVESGDYQMGDGCVAEVRFAQSR